jgi:hypothetical protein
MNSLDKATEKPLECPVPHKQRSSFKHWFKRLGFVGFLFFLIKGLLWIIVPYLVAKGFFI